ncbi:Lipopolysaccharide biosynthesis protein wzxC [Serratia proteamaculans]|uniref:MOP flippase family protein n=1 Tax=Serratia proteamaculans TaxID=28151 RepID=UPI00217A2C68|nr:MOP flippase family protein [Serratia proteamaculans]CAI0780334.1 Lipopolysaccharide biosynthesis protein wzxC [Serratia proteamaculans]CAI1569307.1 Lipopolysaccharide biosynthesis protein wzxC [Serratia proteamaculans]
MGFFNNVKWVTLSQLIKVSCQLLGMVIFSRYLTPGEIGVMSMTLIVVNFVNVLRDMGSSAAIIQRGEITDSLKCSVFFLNLFLGIALFIIAFSLSGVIAEFFKEPELVNTIKIVAIAFPINSATAVHLALLERESKFSKTARVEIGASILALVIAIFFVVRGAGVYSLVIQTVLYAVISSLGFWIYSAWLPKFKFKVGDVKSIFKFSSNLVGFNFINYFSRNSDQIIIGRSFSSSILGQYSLAYRIMLFPIQNITFVLTRSLYPVLSRLQDNNNEAVSVYFKVIKTIAIIIPPLMLGMAVVSREFVHVVFGEQWTMVSSMLIWLAPIAIMQSMVSTTGSVFMSRGRTDILLKISIYNSILQVGAFVIGGLFSISFLIKLYLIANVLMFFPNMFLAVRIIGGNFIGFFYAIFRPIIAAVIMTVILISISYYISDFHFDSMVLLILKIAFGILTYAIALVLLEWRFLSGWFRSRLAHRL